jgi:hypothetical protein
MIKNPYVLLGIPFGSSRDLAQAAFARRARRLRRQPNGAQLLTDLTWALNQIDEVLRDPSLAVSLYRVPADPSALVPEQPGLLNPPVELLEPRYTLDGEARLEALRAVYREAIEVMTDELSNHVMLPGR